VVRLGKDTRALAVPLAYVEAVYRAHEPEAEWVLRLSGYIKPNDQTGGLFLAKEVSPDVARYFDYRWS
jgi:hypothetical protein